eukprot:4724466-Pyramimonas_sp.AAC.1
MDISRSGQVVRSRTLPLSIWYDSRPDARLTKNVGYRNIARVAISFVAGVDTTAYCSHGSQEM